MRRRDDNDGFADDCPPPFKRIRRPDGPPGDGPPPGEGRPVPWLRRVGPGPLLGPPILVPVPSDIPSGKLPEDVGHLDFAEIPAHLECLAESLQLEMQKAPIPLDYDRTRLNTQLQQMHNHIMRQVRNWG